jgi:hypothetical protein
MRSDGEGARGEQIGSWVGDLVKRSKYLTGAAADNLREATVFAGERGTPINCAISINWALVSGHQRLRLHAIGACSRASASPT